MRVQGLLAAVAAAILAVPAASAPAAPPYPITPPTPTLHTGRACYLARQPVDLTGAGFAPDQPYVASIGGVNWTPSQLPTTDANGDFTTHGLPGVAFEGTRVQVRLSVTVTDGTSTARTAFTVTRTPGALLQTGPRTTVASRVPILVWGYAVNTPPAAVYVHYLTPAGRARTTVALGTTNGPCGYLRGSLGRLFPFRARPGRWTLEVDTSRRYVPHQVGPAHRFSLTIR